MILKPIRSMSLHALLACTLLPLPRLRADEAKPNARTITVVGAATVEVTPDMAVLSVTAKIMKSTASEVVEEQNRLIEQIQRAMLDQKINKDDISTSNAHFGAFFERKHDENVFKGYQATSDITIKIRDLKAYKPVWKALAGINGATIDQIHFDHSERTLYQDRARVNAVKAAKKKAESLAAAGDCTIGLPVTIRDQTSNYSFSGQQMISNLVQTSSTESVTGSGGKLQIQGSVEVVYELNPDKK
ncbi:MAG: SIMPL domain-containing protein [Gemmataceae bacterium]